ncbi:MAG: hypothetical protein WC755_02080 [Candidatus Woesearchaeota archaeon]
MKITDSVERECCAFSDLVQYNGEVGEKYKKENLSFCKYCGQIFIIKQGNGNGSELSIYKIIPGKKDE